MQMSPINLDYKNISLSESMKMVEKSKKQPDGITGRKEPKFDSYLTAFKTNSRDCPADVSSWN